MKHLIDSQNQRLFGGREQDQKRDTLSLETGETKHFALLVCVTAVLELLEIYYKPFFLFFLI